MQGLKGSKAKPQQKIAYSRPASETSLITVHFTDQTQYYCKQSGKLPTAKQQELCSCYSTTGTPRPKLVVTKIWQLHTQHPHRYNSCKYQWTPGGHLNTQLVLIHIQTSIINPAQPSKVTTTPYSNLKLSQSGTPITTNTCTYSV